MAVLTALFVRHGHHTNWLQPDRGPANFIAKGKQAVTAEMANVLDRRTGRTP